MSFEIDGFIAGCREALAADGSHKLVREVIGRAVSEPAAIIKALGEPHRAGLTTLYRSADLTILNIAWAPYMTLMPHNHNMWGIIGIYTGREDNIFWRRVPGRLEAAGAKALGPGRRRSARPRYHSFGYQSTARDRCPSCLRRRLFWCRSQRMGSRDALRA
jgi:hypothetical protein